MPTSTAAAPTKLWRTATSSGIDVIATRAASTAPDRRPDRDGQGEEAPGFRVHAHRADADP